MVQLTDFTLFKIKSQRSSLGASLHLGLSSKMSIVHELQSIFPTVPFT